MLAHGAGAAGAHDIAGVAGVALPEDGLARREAARNRDVDDLGEILLAESRERGHGLQKGDRLLGGGGHTAMGTTPKCHLSRNGPM